VSNHKVTKRKRSSLLYREKMPSRFIIWL